MIKKIMIFAPMIFCFLALPVHGAFKVKSEDLKKEDLKNTINDIWMFELFNKNPQSIVFQLYGSYQNQSHPLLLKTIDSGGKTRAIIYGPILKEYSLNIWLKETKTEENIKLVQYFQKLNDRAQKMYLAQASPREKNQMLVALNDKNIKNPLVKVKISNPTNKTMYLTFDQNGTLRPAGGAIKGFLGVGKTDSGLSLKNNIKANQIIPY